MTFLSSTAFQSAENILALLWSQHFRYRQQICRCCMEDLSLSSQPLRVNHSVVMGTFQPRFEEGSNFLLLRGDIKRQRYREVSTVT
jgi:hypothetical protein